MSIHEYNGGTLVGMVGKDCVGIACDRRFGKELLTITNDFQRVFKLQDNIIMGLGGLGTDIQTFSALMEQKVNLYTLKENKPMKPITFCNLVAYSLFEKRYLPAISKIRQLDCSAHRGRHGERTASSSQLRLHRRPVHDRKVPMRRHRLLGAHGHLRSLLQARHGGRRTQIQTPADHYCSLRSRYAFRLGSHRVHC